MTAAASFAVALGLALGLGGWLVLSSVPRLGRRRLLERVAPYVADISAEARAVRSRRGTDPSPVLALVASPLVDQIRGIAATLLGGNDAVAKRLRQAGSRISVERFRAEQLMWGTIGFAAAGVISLAVPTFATLPTAARIAAPFIAALLGVALRDWAAQRSARVRLARISAELPTVLEFLTLSLTAGEGMLDSIRRIGRIGTGDLPAEFAHVVAAVGAGVPLADALKELRDGLDHPALSRAIDQVLGALERGAPLAAVLKAQAGDAREESKRTIIETASRKEIAMLVPLIFLILPVTIAFALFPGYLVLQAGF